MSLYNEERLSSESTINFNPGQRYAMEGLVVKTEAYHSRYDLSTFTVTFTVGGKNPFTFRKVIPPEPEDLGHRFVKDGVVWFRVVTGDDVPDDPGGNPRCWLRADFGKFPNLLREARFHSWAELNA